MKIERLTDAQTAHMEAFREEWRAVGLATGPADIDAITPVIDRFYAAIGKPEPIIWRCDSPLMIELWINVLRDNLGDNLRDNLWANLRDNLWANLRDNLRDNLWANLGDNLGDNLRANLWANLGDNLRANLWANLWANLRDNLRDNLWANLLANLGANLRANLQANLGENLGENLRNNLWANLGNNLWDNLWANLLANLGANLRANLQANLLANLGANLRNNLWANLGNNLWDNLRANLGNNLWANLLDNLEANLRANLGANLGDKLTYTGTWLWGSLDSYWVAHYLYPHLHLRPMHSEAQMQQLNDWAALARSCFWWYPFEGICFVSDRPTFIGQDERHRLHCDSGPAVAFSDGWNEYYVHGVHVPPWIIEQPETLTAAKIDSETNAEVRRVMIDRYTPERYLRDGNAQLVNEDAFGRLWRKPVKNDEPILMVELQNSTAEPDGTYKTYWLRVKPTCRTAHEAVASTWVDGNNQPIFADYREYKPVFES